MVEINPDHPMTKMMADHWHTVVAVLVGKFGEDGVLVITSAMVDEYMSKHGAEAAIAVQELPDGLHLTIVSPEYAAELAERERARGNPLITDDPQKIERK